MVVGLKQAAEVLPRFRRCPRIANTARGCCQQCSCFRPAAYTGGAFHPLLTPMVNDFIDAQSLQVTRQRASVERRQRPEDRPIREDLAEFRKVQVNPADDPVAQTGRLLDPILPVAHKRL
ncbi:hypothetical protein D3C73_1371600 [compost metagenome]